MNLSIHAVLLSVVALVGGCATTPVPVKDATPISETQILNSAMLKADAIRTERVLIVRDSGFMGSALEAVIWVDKKAIFSLNTKQSAILYLAPGKHMFTITAKKNFLGEPPGESEIDIIKSGLNNFRLRLVPGDGPRLERSQYLE